MEFEKRIRPSSLTGWNDCARRQVASAYPMLVSALGYQLRSLPSHIGAAVGTGVHKGNEVALVAKMKTGKLGAWDECENAAVESAAEQIKAGVMWDGLTDNRKTAERQVRRMVKAYYEQIAPEVEPLVIEERLEADAGGGWVLSGQPDTLTHKPGELRDTKTGAQKRANGVQYGAYGLLFRAHDYEMDVIKEDFIRRTAIHKDQPRVETESPPLGPSIMEAWATVQNMRQRIDGFVEMAGSANPTQPPETVLRVNPMSPLCSEKFCPAWGTKFCRAHKGAK